MRFFFLLLGLVLAGPAFAQDGINNPGASKADLAAATANMCQPLAAVPPMETVGGSGGTGTSCRLSNAVQPRISRATTCTLDGNSACAITWATALPAVPNVIITPINTAGSQPIACNLTATPTTTTVSIKCWISQSTLISAALVTVGLTLQPFASAVSGTQVQIVAIPPTQ